MIWGNRFDENTSPEVCRKIDDYVTSTLGPYLQTKQNEVIISQFLGEIFELIVIETIYMDSDYHSFFCQLNLLNSKVAII